MFTLSLGCSKNLVDTERMLGYLRCVEHIQIVNNPNQADIVLINTCGFIEPAKEESIESIAEAVSLKNRKPTIKLIVAGCLYERYQEELKRGFPEVDCFIGVHELKRIVECLYPGTPPPNRSPRMKINNSHISYLKISDGCSNGCTFCSIPLIKGSLRSIEEEKLINEAYRMHYSGVKELCIVAQDTTAYMNDRGVHDALPCLLKKLDRIGFERIRLMYTYPSKITEHLLDTIASSNTIAHYLDIPIQHASDRVLKSMGRKYTRDDIETLLTLIRNTIPDISLRSTFIVGYPAEQAEDFEQLKAFIKSARLDWAGFFKYYKEEGTLSYHLRDKPNKIKQNRLTEVENLQRSISEEINRNTIGKQFRVIIDGKSNSIWEARTYRSAPETDGMVLLKGAFHPGDVTDVLITGVKDSVDVVGVKV